MFGFGKTKKVDVEKIREYKQAIRAIKIFAILDEWENAYNSIEEVKQKEKDAYQAIIDKISDSTEDVGYKEKSQLTEDYNRKITELKKLEDYIKIKEQKSKEENDKKRFEIRLKSTDNDIKLLLKTNKNQAAMALLTNFYELNKENKQTNAFYNKQKAMILKNLERTKIQEEKRLRQNVKLEALRLIGETLNINEELKNEKSKKGIFSFIRSSLDAYNDLRERIKRKKLIDEVSLLVEEESAQKLELAEQNLERMHKGLTKELTAENILGYDLFGKILGADKISGDTFGFNDNIEKYNLFLGDATGHGVRAGFIVTLFSMAFKKYVEKDLKTITFNINNDLKQDLQSRNFITGILFEIFKNDLGKVNFVGMGHEPVFIYRAKEKTVETLVAGGLAAGIRIIKEVDDVKIKSLNLDDGDILMVYSDGAVEEKNGESVFYGIERLKSNFEKIANLEKNIKNIYDYLINDLKNFKLGTNFVDDTTILLLKRDFNRNIIKKDDPFLEEITQKENLTKSDIKSFEGKTKVEINKEIEKIRMNKELRNVLQSLENLYYTGEILKLKQEAIRYIKKGFVDKKINYYLKKAIDNEAKYKVSQKQQKVENKFNVLSELYKKGDYDTVIRECEDVIIRDGNI